MKFLYKNCILIFFIFIFSCAKDEAKVDQIINASIDDQMIKAYNEGLDALNKQNPVTAAKKFSEAEILYPQSIWAPRSALMTAYSYYLNGSYVDTIDELERYLKTYPLHDRKNYAYYLLALSYYEQIVDEKKDLDPLIKSKNYFNIIINNYPKSEFAVDSKYKLDLIHEILASKEMYLGRYYIEREKWIPAMNRFKIILKDYDRTIYIEEAIHRLVEIHYKIGLIEESKKYASLLGYNYQSSKWYEKTYILFNKDYEKPIKKIEKKKKNSLIKKFKELLK